MQGQRLGPGPPPLQPAMTLLHGSLQIAEAATPTQNPEAHLICPRPSGGWGGGWQEGDCANGGSCCRSFLPPKAEGQRLLNRCRLGGTLRGKVAQKGDLNLFKPLLFSIGPPLGSSFLGGQRCCWAEHRRLCRCGCSTLFRTSQGRFSRRGDPLNAHLGLLVEQRSLSSDLSVLLCVSRKSTQQGAGGLEAGQGIHTRTAKPQEWLALNFF